MKLFHAKWSLVIQCFVTSSQLLTTALSPVYNNYNNINKFLSLLRCCLQYQDQLAQSVMTNTAFHEHIASVINRTLAASGYEVTADEELEEEQQGKGPGTTAASAEHHIGKEGVAVAAAPVEEVTTASCVGGLRIEAQNNAEEYFLSRRTEHFTTPSKMSATVAQTVSKMILDDPNYQEMFFLGLGLCHSAFLSYFYCIMYINVSDCCITTSPQGP